MDVYVLADKIRKLASVDPDSLNRDKAGLISFTFGATRFPCTPEGL
jgi:hypothetical protein